MMVFVNTLIGSGGMFFFIGVMLPVTGWRYAREIQQPARSAAVRQDDRPAPPAPTAPGRATTGTAAQQHIAQPSTPRT
jgi:hypothetical protein